MHDTELLELMNLGKTSARWLYAVGIRTQQQLRDIGSIAAFCKIKQRGFKVSKVLLYALEGALHDVHWNDLDEEVKHHLLKEVRTHYPDV